MFPIECSRSNVPDGMFPIESRRPAQVASNQLRQKDRQLSRIQKSRPERRSPTQYPFLAFFFGGGMPTERADGLGRIGGRRRKGPGVRPRLLCALPNRRRVLGSRRRHAPEMFKKTRGVRSKPFAKFGHSSGAVPDSRRRAVGHAARRTKSVARRKSATEEHEQRLDEITRQVPQLYWP